MGTEDSMKVDVVGVEVEENEGVQEVVILSKFRESHLEYRHKIHSTGLLPHVINLLMS